MSRILWYVQNLPLNPRLPIGSTDHSRFLELVRVKKIHYPVHLVHWIFRHYSFGPWKCPWILCPSQSLPQAKSNISLILRTNRSDSTLKRPHAD